MEISWKSGARWISLLDTEHIREDTYIHDPRPNVYLFIYIFERMGNINNGIQASVSSFVAQ